VAEPGVLVDGGDDPVLGDLAGDRNTPSWVCSRSWPTTLASSCATCSTDSVSSRPSNSAKQA